MILANLLPKKDIFVKLVIKNCMNKGELMTKKEKEIFNWILERSWEKRANPMVIAAALALLFPDGAEDVMKELEKKCVCKEN